MIEMNFHLEGLDSATDRIHDAAGIGLLRAAEHVKAAAQQRAPVESGKLRGSIDVRSHSIDDADVYVPGPYARFQELGPNFNPETLHHEEGESPYLSAAIAAETDRAVQIIADAIRAEGTLQ